MGGSAASQQADPAMQQITEFVSTSINNGEDPVDVVVSLVGQEVDQETIAQIFMQAGYAEEDVIALFEQVQQKMQPPGPASPEQQTQDPQEIARNEAMTQESQMQQAKSGIEIKPENKGKFTKWADARGMSVSEAANKVMSNTEAYPPSVVKMANFAKNAAGWNKKQEGGEQTPEMIEYLKALEFNKEARQAIGTNDKEKLKQLSLDKPYNNNDLARDFSELQKLRQAAGLGSGEEASILFPHVGQQLRGGFNSMFGTNFKEGGEFEPHFMYKGDRKIRAKDMETHLRLKEAGYGHDAPKAQTGLEVDKKGNRFINGVVQARDEWTAAPNYVNPLAFESGNNFSLTDGLQVLGTGINKMFGSGDKNEDGLKDGFFRDLKGKKASRNLKKGDYYNYKIETDPNDPNTYAYDNLDLYNASKNNGSLRDLQTFTDDVKENSRLNYNTETGKYDALISSRELNDDIYGERKGFLGIGKKEGNSTYELGKNFNYFDDIDADTRQQIIDYGNASAKGMPEGTTLSIDPVTGATSYVDPEVDNPNNYNTMMGYNTYGKKEALKAMIPTDDGGQPFSAMSNTSHKELDFLKNIKFKEGGDLPKAQDGDFDFGYSMNNNKPEVPTYFENLFSGKTDYMKDTQAVADAQLQKENPGLGRPGSGMGSMFLDQQELQKELDALNQNDVSDQPKYDEPTVKRTNKIQGGFNRFMDSRAMKGYTGGSEFAVQGARVLNNFFDDRAIEDAQADNRNNMVADNLYATKENPMLKRGAWDINTGTFGSEGQRTVRTNMGIAKEGGEIATVDSLLLARLIAAGADIEIL